MRFTAGNDSAAGGASGVPVVAAFTHAAATSVEPVIVIETDTGSTLRYLSGRYIEIHTADGRTETLPLSANPHKHMLSAFAAWVRGSHGLLGSSLEMARAHVVAVNAASEAAPVIDVPMEYIQRTTAHDGANLNAILGIVPALRACVAEDCLLHETGLAPWAQPTRTLAINGYHHFAGPAAAAAAPPTTTPLAPEIPRVSLQTSVQPIPRRAALANPTS